jgi:UDPglucose--hexose-1-phosphate uridylyltransferase
LPELRKDPVTSRWVIVNLDHPKTADSFLVASNRKSSKVCPFCPGKEAMTPPAIFFIPKKGAPKGSADWQVRVIPNKFPALKIEENTEKIALGVYDKMGGFGAHEVIIENPDHHQEIMDLGLEEVCGILKAYRERCLDLRRDPRFRYILIFKNYGASAGATLEHPHSQLIGLPIIPSRVGGELRGAFQHHRLTERCIFCDLLSQEHHEKKRIILDEGGFTALAPFVSRFPFETWILPKNHESSFDHISDEDIWSLALVLRLTLAKIKAALKDPAFNFMIHTAPIAAPAEEPYHWHIEVIPRLTQVAGFEWGTGFYVNPTPPELAARTLRSENPRIIS